MQIKLNNKYSHMVFYISLLIFIVFIWIVHSMYYPENMINEKDNNFKYPEHLDFRFNTMKLLLNNSRKDKDEIDDLWKAIIIVESNNNPSAYNQGENAVGVSQIRPIVISDLHRIGYANLSNKDRWCPQSSKRIFNKYTSYWISRMNVKDTYENRARIWNGGPRGYEKNSTMNYWDKVQEHL